MLLAYGKALRVAARYVWQQVEYWLRVLREPLELLKVAWKVALRHV